MSTNLFVILFQHLAKLNEGASILLTWIINLIKWNAGVVKYKFRLLEDQN